MAAPEQVLAILFAYLLFFLLVSYVHRRFIASRGDTSDDADSTPTPTPLHGRQQPPDGEPYESPSASAIVCRNCQTVNDRDYTYCKICVSQL